MSKKVGKVRGSVIVLALIFGGLFSPNLGMPALDSAKPAAVVAGMPALDASSIPVKPNLGMPALD